MELPGVDPGPRPRRKVDWELVVCGLRGHVLLGTDAEEVRAEDAVIVREYDGARWHRCLRCDSWVGLPAPHAPPAEHPPDRDQIEIPLRGRALRDQVVLRLIAVERSLHFIVLTLLGVAVLLFAANRRSLHADFYRVVTALQSAVGGGPVQRTGHVGLVHDLDHLFSLSKGTLHVVAAVIIGYGLLEGVEAVGLWYTKRWAEYLTVLATALLLPLEIDELVATVTFLKVLGFAVNLAVVVYLLWAKRLFGLRGGGAVDERERAAGMSWAAIERATPPPGQAR